MKKLKLIILYCIAMIVALTVVGIRYIMLPFHKIYEWADDFGTTDFSSYVENCKYK